MAHDTGSGIPRLFRQLMELGCLTRQELWQTGDGFRAAGICLAEILARKHIETLPGEGGAPLECRLFFDDWYLYAIPCGEGHVYSLFKMREQEQDLNLGLKADGDTPGVTVSFIALDPDALLACLNNPSSETAACLNREINRVVAAPKQRHHDCLRDYFLRTEAQGPYRIALAYTDYIASLARDSSLPVPERYASDYQKTGLQGRLPKFLEENNRAAGYTVCDHRQIFIREPGAPTPEERLAILATHTADVSFFCFAAEVQFHAQFLKSWVRVLLPRVYASALRADMSIADAEFAGPTPYHNPRSTLVRQQLSCHRDDTRCL